MGITSSTAPDMTQPGVFPKLRSPLIAGVISGEVGLVVFLTIHHFWIVPIWFIVPAGLLIAGLSGLAVGWAYAELRSQLPSWPWTYLAVFGLMAATQAPALLVAEILPPAADVAAGRLVLTTNELIFRFIFGLLAPAALIGVLEGWTLARSGRGAAAMALAGLLFALGLGHNIPFLGHTPAVGKEIVLLVAITLVSSVTLVTAHAWLERYQASDGEK